MAPVHPIWIVRHRERIRSRHGLRRPGRRRCCSLDEKRIDHGEVLRAIVGDIEGGADSLAEIDVGKLARTAGPPPPIRQSCRLDGDGRRRYLDVDVGTFSVEVDGGFHLRAMLVTGERGSRRRR
jgi:hypothetical protein